MDIIKIKELLEPYLEEKGIYLYDIGFVSNSGMRVLQVLIDTHNGITIDELVDVNHFLSEKLDLLDNDMPEYVLEVSSPGAECQLRNKTEIERAVGKYIHINTQGKIYEGTLEAFDGEKLIVRVNLKGRFKNFEIDYAQIDKIRMAIKF